MLVDREVLDKIVKAAEIAKDEIVCEAGTGQGMLTAELCRLAKHVISYEVDSNLYQKAQALLRHCQNLTLVRADLFKTRQDELHFDVFISNLPYSRSRDAFEWLALHKFDRAVVMVQKEFADKLVAKAGDKNYRAVSVLAGYRFRINELFGVGRYSFKPPPKVESVVLKVVPIKNVVVTRETIRNLNFLFSKRNKKASSVAAKATAVSNNSSSCSSNGSTGRICAMTDYYGCKRIDQLPHGEIIRLAESMKNNEEDDSVRPV